MSLCAKSTSLNETLIEQRPHRTSWIMFDQKAGHWGPAKLTHSIILIINTANCWSLSCRHQPFNPRRLLNLFPRTKHHLTHLWCCYEIQKIYHDTVLVHNTGLYSYIINCSGEALSQHFVQVDKQSGLLVSFSHHASLVFFWNKSSISAFYDIYNFWSIFSNCPLISEFLIASSWLDAGAICLLVEMFPEVHALTPSHWRHLPIPPLCRMLA